MTVSYQYEVASSTSGGFTRLLFMWKGSLYKLIYRELLLFLAAFGLLSALYRNAFNSDQRKIFEKMVMYCDTFINLIPLSFVLGFYVAYVAGRWWQQYMAIPWPDKIMHSIALYVSGSDEHARMVRRTLMRYLNLTLILVLRSISSAVKRRFPTLEHVVEAGFMTSVELEMFQSVPSVEFNTYWIPCTWFISLLKETKKKNQIEDSQGLHIIMEEFNEFRSKCGLLWSYDWVSIPLVYTQVVTIATYSFFLAALVGRQYVDAAKKPLQMEIDIYLPVFTILQFFFFMGLLKVAEQLINPFGDDDEDFELNWLIDRHTKVSYLGVDILMASAPPLVKDMYFDQVDLTLPYTEASVAYKKKTYRGSVHNMTVPEDKHTMFLPEISEEDEDRTPTPRSSLSNAQSMVHSRPTEPALVAAAAAGTWRSRFPSTQSFHKAFEVDSQFETSATAARNLEMCMDMAAFSQEKKTKTVVTKSSESKEDGKITRPLSRSESVPAKKPVFVAKSMLGWPSSSTLGHSNTSCHYSEQSIEIKNCNDSSANFEGIYERTSESNLGPESPSSIGAMEKVRCEFFSSDMTSNKRKGADDNGNICGDNCRNNEWCAYNNRTGRGYFTGNSGISDGGGGEYVDGGNGGDINIFERCGGGGSSNSTTRGGGRKDGDSNGNGDCGIVSDQSAIGTDKIYVTGRSGGDGHSNIFDYVNEKNPVTDHSSDNDDADDAIRKLGEISSTRKKKLNLRLDVTCNHSPYLSQSSPESPPIPKQYEHYLCKHKEETDYVTFRKSFRSACLAKVKSCPKLVLVRRQHSANSGRKKGVRWKPMINNVSWRDPSCVRRQTVEIVPVTSHPSGVNLFFPSKTNVDEVDLLNRSILDTHCLWCKKQTEYRRALLQRVTSGDREQFVNTSADSVSNSSFSQELCSLHNRMNPNESIKVCSVPSTRHIIGTEVLTSKSLPFQERRATVSTLNFTGTELEEKRWQSRSFWERGFFKKMKLLYSRQEIKAVPSAVKKTSLYLNNKRSLSHSLPNIVFPHFQSESQSTTNKVPTSMLLNKAMSNIRFGDLTSTESDSSSRFASIMEMQEEEEKEENYNKGNSSSSVVEEDNKRSSITVHLPFAPNSVASKSNSGYSSTPSKDPSLQSAGWIGITDSDHLYEASSDECAEQICALKETCSVSLSGERTLNASSTLQEVVIDNGNNSSSNEQSNKYIS